MDVHSVDMYLKEFDKLNEYQKTAVTSMDRYVLLNAAVGSGKTTVLVHKVLYLHLIKNIPLEDMVVLTFTKKAAAEMKNRIANFGKELEAGMKYFGTFHGVAMTILSESSALEELGYKNDFLIIDNDEASKILFDIIENVKLNIKYKSKLIKRIEEFKKGKPLYGIMKNYDDIELLFKLYNKEKINRNVMDFDDIIENCIKVLKNPLNKRWLIVDEFQDTDVNQLKLIKKMAGSDTNIFCIGDPNQIIYSWRTGTENIFADFKSMFNVKEMTLPLNYRSTKTIIEAANSFLYGTSIEGSKEYGNKIKIIKNYDAFNEADYIAKAVKRFHDLDILYKSMAVLYRRQSQLEVLMDVLTKENIPCKVVFKNTLSFEDMGNFDEEDAINLLTLHASKGLEFSHVFIIGANMGNIPLCGRKNEEPEESRLFYVGITRAKNNLEISYLSNPSLPGVLPYKSPYISMIPSKLITSEEEGNSSTLTELMNMLRDERAKNESQKTRRARHVKYGIGTIIYEDEDNIRVSFEGYGEKEFSKMFCPLEFIT